MTCCIGKARIYFREPINYWLTYQLPDGSFGSVTAPEPLVHNCIIAYPWTQEMNVFTYALSSGVGIAFVGTLYPPYQLAISNQTVFRVLAEGWGYSHPFGHPSRVPKYILRGGSGQISTVGVKAEPRPPIGSQVYTFEVVGTETETVYTTVSGEECPSVISNICLMGEERYVDVEMGNILKPFNPILSPFLPDCIIAVDFPDSIQLIRRKVAIPRPIDFPVLNLKKLPGCDPEYRVVCCPDGQCEPEECPPDTDCSLDCGDYVCCYKDGKVIKTIQK